MESEHLIDFAGFASGVEGLGPGKRVVLWVRGCRLACPGCMTPELWTPSPIENFRSVEAVAALLRPLLATAEGLSISGGEPMQQAAALTVLVQLLKVDMPDLEVLVYSGHTLEELLLQGPGQAAFLEEIDILIDGRFQNETSNELPWRGSDNQRTHYLTARGERHRPIAERVSEERPLQLQMLGNGQFRIIGIPRRGDLEKYRQMMLERGLGVEKVKRG